MKLPNYVFENQLLISSLNKVLDCNLPIKNVYKLSKLVKELNDKEVGYQEARLKLLKKYGEDKGENGFEIEKDKVEEFNNEWKSLLEIEEEYNYNKIDLNVNKINVELSLKELDILSNLFNIVD